MPNLNLPSIIGGELVLRMSDNSTLRVFIAPGAEIKIRTETGNDSFGWDGLGYKMIPNQSAQTVLTLTQLGPLYVETMIETNETAN